MVLLVYELEQNRNNTSPCASSLSPDFCISTQGRPNAEHSGALSRASGSRRPRCCDWLVRSFDQPHSLAPNMTAYCASGTSTSRCTLIENTTECAVNETKLQTSKPQAAYSRPRLLLTPDKASHLFHAKATTPPPPDLPAQAPGFRTGSRSTRRRSLWPLWARPIQTAG